MLLQARHFTSMAFVMQTSVRRATMHDAALQVVHFLNARAASFPTGLAGVPDHECLNLFMDDLVSKTALDDAMLRLKCWYGGFYHR